MDIFRSVTNTVLGNPQSGNQPTGAETVERLLDRVQSSTLLEDRRDGCRALKALSKKYRLIVGAHGMDTLIQVLESDRSDHEIVNYALETLVNITSEDVFTEEGEEENSTELQCAKIGEQFTEIFIKRFENIALIMSLMDEFDFKVRFPAMKLLNNLLQNRLKEVQEAVLVTPSGVSKLMDMLSDSREIIRNDTLLLLTQLTKGNTNLQKIVVFENAFDHLFDIIKEEGQSEGGVVVEDCLILMQNLLKNNPSNQTLFKEGTYIQKMCDFFCMPLDNEDAGWSAQKVANVHYMLKLQRTLVSPENSAHVISSCQKKMRSCNLLSKLCTLLMAVGVPADILSDTIATVSEVIRGNRENQEYFSGVNAPSVPPRPAIVVLLMSMVNEKQPFSLRCSVLYCFQCFLYKNPKCQAQIVQTLLPQTAEEANQITAGQLLCGGLFASDPVSNWFSALALSHALLDNTNEKEQLLRVQLATGAGSPPVSLLQQCTSLLQGGSKLLTRLGVLQLLCTWLAHCPVAVTHLLSLNAVIPHLTAYLSANEHDEMELTCQGLCAFLIGICAYFTDGSVPTFGKDALAHLVSNRVGAEPFCRKVDGVLRTEAYSRAAKSPQMSAKQPSEIVFDHEFTKMFKALEASVQRCLFPQISGEGEGDIGSPEVTRYKELIREQDVELTRLRAALEQTRHEVGSLRKEREEEKERKKKKEEEEGMRRPGQVQEQAQKETSAKMEVPPITGDQPPTGSTDAGTVAPSGEQLALLQHQLTEMTHARDYYYYQMVEKDNQLQNNQTPPTSSSTPNPEMENLRKQLEDLQLALYRKDEQIQHLKDTPPAATPAAPARNPAENAPHQLQQESNLPAVHTSSIDESLVVKRLENHISSLEREKNELETRLTEAQVDRAAKQEQIEALSNLDAAKRVFALEGEMSRLHSEQEDLLVLLTDQETKMADMKRTLRKFGEVFSEDDDDDDEGNDEDCDDGGDMLGVDLDLDVSTDDDDDDVLRMT